MWLDAMRAKFDGKGKRFGRKEFDQLLGHCQADTPFLCDSVYVASQIDQCYPGRD